MPRCRVILATLFLVSTFLSVCIPYLSDQLFGSTYTCCGVNSHQGHSSHEAEPWQIHQLPAVAQVSCDLHALAANADFHARETMGIKILGQLAKAMVSSRKGHNKS
jgi:hypothetical protein